MKCRRADKTQKRGLEEGNDPRAGMTLVEAMMGMGITMVMCAGIYTVGINLQGFSETQRVAVEARSLAKQKLEEIISVGAEQLAEPACTLVNESSHESEANYVIRRVPRVIWHASNGSITNASAAVFAEVHVDVYYTSPQTRSLIKETFTTMLD